MIVGDSLFAEIAHEYFTHDSPYEVMGFAVEAEYKQRGEFRGLPLVEFEMLQEAFDPSEHEVYVALTTPRSTAPEAKGYSLASYVSSNAFVWRNVELGEHCFIFEDNTLQPFVKVGRKSLCEAATTSDITRRSATTSSSPRRWSSPAPATSAKIRFSA